MTRGLRTALDHRPGTVLQIAAIAFAVLAAGTAATVARGPALLGIAGVTGVVAGGTGPYPRVGRAGAATVILGAVLAGVRGLGSPGLLLAVLAGVLCWELQRGAIAATTELRGGRVVVAEYLHVVVVTAGAGLVGILVDRGARLVVVSPSPAAAALLTIAALALSSLFWTRSRPR